MTSPSFDSNTVWLRGAPSGPSVRNDTISDWSSSRGSDSALVSIAAPSIAACRFAILVDKSARFGTDMALEGGVFGGRCASTVSAPGADLAINSRSCSSVSFAICSALLIEDQVNTQDPGK